MIYFEFWNQRNTKTLQLYLTNISISKVTYLSWFFVLCSLFLILGSWFLALGSWFLALGSCVLGSCVLGSCVLAFFYLGSWFYNFQPHRLFTSINHPEPTEYRENEI